MKLKLIAWGVGITTIATTTFVGFLYLVNLPYPMIRRPISQVAPLLLLPSYMEMDRNYREAIAHVEQADQLINHASSFEDIQLGEQKVKIAQQNLDKLPVWFIGYEPKRYCTLFSCSWQFTIDEFEAARRLIGRMEAIIFQEKNAFNTYQQAQNNLQQAQQNYQQATQPKEKQKSLVNWQRSLDKLQQLPKQTLAATLARENLDAYQRDFQAIAGNVQETEKGQTMIQVAQKFSSAAVSLCQNPPHVVEQWEQCRHLWQQAIERLKTVSSQEAGYLETQTLLAEYETNLSLVEIRSQAEAKSVTRLDTAKQQIQNIQGSFANGVEPSQTSQFVSELQAIIEQLKKIQAGTTVYPEAQELLRLAQSKLKKVTK